MPGRRAIIGGLGGMAAAMALGPAAQPHPRRRAPRLRLGDTVGLIAPASSDNAAELAFAQSNIRGMGLVPQLGRHVGDHFGYLAGTDADRAADINAMFADPAIRAIFAVRGGWGSARLLPLLDWDLIRAHPKLVIGSSDITTLHLAIAARAGFPTIHGPNASSRWQATSWNSLWRLAFTGETPLLGGDGPPVTMLHPGVARGRLLGGNLTILSTLMGTRWLPSFDGAILFMEDVEEAEYRIDRMLNQLALSGVLGRVAGVVFGQCTRCHNDVPDYAGFSVADVLGQYLGGLGVPAITGANIGHITNQLCLPFGAEVELDAGAGMIRVTEAIVE